MTFHLIPPRLTKAGHGRLWADHPSELVSSVRRRAAMSRNCCCGRTPSRLGRPATRSSPPSCVDGRARRRARVGVEAAGLRAHARVSICTDRIGRDDFATRSDQTERGEAMQVAPKNAKAMCGLGLDDDDVEIACRRAADDVDRQLTAPAVVSPVRPEAVHKAGVVAKDSVRNA